MALTIVGDPHMKEYKNTVAMLVSAFLVTWAMMTAAGQTTGNIMTFVYFGLACLLFRFVTEKVQGQEFPDRKRVYIVSSVLGGAFTIAWMWMKADRYLAEYSLPLFRVGLFVVLFLGFGALFIQCLLLVYTVADSIYRGKLLLAKEESEKAGSLRSGIKVQVLAFPVTILCFLPVFLYNYPGIFSPDAVERLEGALGLRPLSNHHSVYHSLLMGFWVKLGKSIFGSLTAGVALLSLFQLCLMAFTISYMIWLLDRKKIRKGVQVIALALMILNPYNANYSINMFKDCQFGMAVVLCIGSLLFLLDEDTKNKAQFILHTAIFAVAGTVISVFRNNGWYAFAVFSVVCFVLYFKKRKRVYPALVTALLFTFILRVPVMNYLNPQQPDMAESLAVPMQQLARVVYNQREIAPEYRELLSAVWDLEQIPYIMDVSSSDNLKILIRNSNLTYYKQIKDHLGEYAKMYLALGIKYPKDYMDALRDETCGFWFPDNLYGRLPDIEGIFMNDLGLSRTNLIPGALHLYEIAIYLYTIMPIYGIFGSPGSLFWILLIFAGFCVIEKKSDQLMIYLLPVLISGTLFVATPASYEYRYAYYQLLGLSLFVLLPFVRKDKEIC